MNYINETTVLDFYLSQIEEDKIKFLQDREELKEEVKKNVIELRGAEDLHEKIEIAKKLWKALFKASMSYIDSDMRGYDDLFKYFDEYVNFEELIFASDSFYRDHTMHCLWVYFLGEYLFRKEEFKGVFNEYNRELNNVKKFSEVINKCELDNYFNEFNTIIKSFDIEDFEDSIRCVAALTHDLGYPIKKINKVNSCIGKILPYFSLNNYKEFNFSYNTIQQGFIDNFINLMSKNISFQSDNIVGDEEKEEYFKKLVERVFEFDKSYSITSIKEEELRNLDSSELKSLKRVLELKAIITEQISERLRYNNDFEQYQHGIMSAFLLMKTLKAFSTVKLLYVDNQNLKMGPNAIKEFQTKRIIMGAIADHDSASFRVSGINRESDFLILIDELEEFSRISRANMNRQYVEEFCKSKIYYEEGVLNIDFVFDNENIANLDPERAFKGRCNRFLSLFNIKELSPNLRIRLRCIGKLPYDDNVYTLEIGRKYANIIINNEEQNIPKYLKSSEFHTKEMYMKL